MKLPKLHVRDLLWLVLVCALALGWWSHAQKQTEERNKLLDAIQQRGFRLVVGETYRLVPTWPLPNDNNWFSQATQNSEVEGVPRNTKWTPPPHALRDGLQLDSF